MTHDELRKIVDKALDTVPLEGPVDVSYCEHLQKNIRGACDRYWGSMGDLSTICEVYHVRTHLIIRVESGATAKCTRTLELTGL